MINGVGVGLLFMPLTVVVLSGVEPRHAGTASGLLQTTQQIGGALGLAVIVTVYASHSVPGEFTPGLREAMDTGSILASDRACGRRSAPRSEADDRPVRPSSVSAAAE